MGPNLTKLFELSEEYLDANQRLSDIFTMHGEALIEALEKCLLEMNYCNRQLLAKGIHEGYSVTEAREKATKLLAQLEVEAKP